MSFETFYIFVMLIVFFLFVYVTWCAYSKKSNRFWLNILENRVKKFPDKRFEHALRLKHLEAWTDPRLQKQGGYRKSLHEVERYALSYIDRFKRHK